GRVGCRRQNWRNPTSRQELRHRPIPHSWYCVASYGRASSLPITLSTMRNLWLVSSVVVLLACAGGTDPEQGGLPPGNPPGNPPPAGDPSLGPNVSLNGYRPFPDDNPWNTPVDNAQVDPNSAKIIASIGV